MIEKKKIKKNRNRKFKFYLRQKENFYRTLIKNSRHFIFTHFAKLFSHFRKTKPEAHLLEAFSNLLM